VQLRQVIATGAKSLEGVRNKRNKPTSVTHFAYSAYFATQPIAGPRAGLEDLMKAMILAAGKGTRVRPITYVLPKPMIPLVRKPVMEFLIEHLKAHGVSEIVVNTSHLASVIEEYFRDGERFGVQMAYSFEGNLVQGQLEGIAVGSAGGMKKIQDFSGFFDETFVVLCGDAVVDVDFAQVLQFHRKRKSIATLVLRDVPKEDVFKYGVVKMDATGRITQFQEKPKREEAISATINTGIYMFEPEVFRYIPSGVEFDIGGQLLPELVRAGQKIFGITLPFTWVDIGSVPDYWDATRLLLTGGVQGFAMPGREVRPGIYCGINVQIPWDRVQIQGPVYIGSSTSVGEGATIIGPSVIGSGCVIQPGATLKECILADYTRVTSVAYLERKLIFGNKCIDPSGSSLDIAENQIGWLVEDARKKEELSEIGIQFQREIRALTAP
jgi:mannose-1-phosphate guanylyltransferase